MAAAAKFTSGGKGTAKKDLALIAMQYGHVYIARVAFGAKDSQTLAALREAEAYADPAPVIAYSHCIAHGFPRHLGLEQQKLAVDTGYWPLFRYDPRLVEQGEVWLRLDSGPPKAELAKFMANETRFGILKNIDPDRAGELATRAQAQVRSHYAIYQQLAAPPAGPAGPAASPTPRLRRPNPESSRHEFFHPLSWAEIAQSARRRGVPVLRQPRRGGAIAGRGGRRVRDVFALRGTDRTRAAGVAARRRVPGRKLRRSHLVFSKI
jgi:hypothetical protein